MTSVDVDLAEIVESSNKFAISLYSTLSKQISGNLFFSPSSITTALAMVYAGAAGQTAREMADAMRVNLPSSRMLEALRQLQIDTDELQMASRLWGQQGYHFRPAFLETIARHGEADLGQVDFQGATETARRQINAWVEGHTGNKIKDLIPPDMLDSLARLVLTNAVYFLSSWQHPFADKATVDATFWESAHLQQPIRMMRRLATFSYGECEEGQSLEMPYRRPEPTTGDTDYLSMVIFLPRSVNGLKEVEGKLSYSAVQRWTTLVQCPVDVQLPKFRFGSALMLRPTLESMGIRKIFSLEAELSGMADDPAGLYVADAIHKSFIDVSERGTEAAAATAIVTRAGCRPIPTPPKVFRADHPFLFLIRDQRTGLIHFIGRLSETP